ncbi:glycosyltransferase family 4 protein [Microbulbifer rhizosphaerae]|uniref:Glycosyltransferase involved in cell wall biosynthesis n=1 Tax=Microbulbifer rhizosphaerae TaxID=1562603 RepID=A0A7W4WCV2_9GAMM|nr:glycosyltransferase family 4 protein [Microbulbifer rhizosphaerae]MBB3061890.1 glycosyltransferase involved in cell wall biosynthesis [Microbulbifer rhizosphaerae]
MTEQRILIVSHGHPDHSKGGAEVAAYNLFKEYQRQGLDTVFLARTDQPSHGGSAFSTINSDREILFHTHMSDFFLFQSGYKRHVWQDFHGLLQRYRPTVVHFHHYIHMGLELIREVKNTLPNARIVLTLHEYLAICANNGQMVKPGKQMKLCYKSSPSDCARCFPDRSTADFFLREKYIKSIFKLVDVFVSPSHFLIERYKVWGIPKEKMVMIENGQPEVEAPPPRPLAEGEARGRFAFFGQINPYKGVDVLLEAFKLLPEDVQEQVHLDIHGANLDIQTKEFQEKIHGLLEDLGDLVTLHGSYESHEIGRLMEQADWVIIPSVWWENSPMVIQEAFNHRRPLIGPDIGGMNEKINDGVDGLLFRSRSSMSLSCKIAEAISSRDYWSKIISGINKVVTSQECASSHLDCVVDDSKGFSSEK